MIVTEFYKGQGLGNQLWCYVTTRIIAEEKGFEFGIKSPENFKGLDFMDIDFGRQVFGGNGPEGGPPQKLPEGILHYYKERSMIHRLSNSDIRTTDEKLINIEDGTKIDGLMQDASYANHRKGEIKNWLKIRDEHECYDYSSDDMCVINFRGGGYVREKDFFLPKKYWDDAVRNMLKINKDFKFTVITDDVKTAKEFFPDYDVFHFSIAKDYSIIKNSKYLIISNSSFAWFPAWLSDTLKFCIAPKYWAKHNISDGYWSLGYNINEGWHYQDKDGVLHIHDTCIKELNEYVKKNKENITYEQTPDPKDAYVPELPKGRLAPTSLKRIQRKLEKIKVDAYNKRKEVGTPRAAYYVSKSLFLQVLGILSQRIERFLTVKTKFPELSKEECSIFDLLKDRLHVVFDVGVRDDLFFYNSKKDCTYHLFEPNKNFVGLLRKKISKLDSHDITLNNYGLADKDADNCIYYEKSQSFEVNPYMIEDTASSERYSVRTLDGYVKEKKISHIDFLKIDAEGFDYKIMLGGIDAIRNNKVSYIQFEYWSGVKKFVDLLGNIYDMYLIMEPVLLQAIQEKVHGAMTEDQRKIDYTKSLIPLNKELIELIDEKLAPIGLGGNILGVHKHIKDPKINDLIFKVSKPNITVQQGIALRAFKAMKRVSKYAYTDIVSISHISALFQSIAEYKAKKNWPSLEKIQDYRKKIKVYDVFTFFNELDLLEMRLNILDQHVDYFVIVEATETFSGHPKPIYFQENKNRFKKWKHKIIHYVIRDTPKNEDDLRSRLHREKNLSALDKNIIKDSLTSDNIGKDALHWFKEFYQKETIKKALVNLGDNDVCYISDLDEIWNPDCIVDYSKDEVFKPIQTGYMYYLNNRTNENWRGWTGTIVTKYKNIKNSCLNHLRTHRKMGSKYVFLKNGGWHFAFQGGYDGAHKKLSDYKHSWYDAVALNLKSNVLYNKHLREENIRLWKDERNLPAYILENRQKYKTLFK